VTLPPFLIRSELESGGREPLHRSYDAGLSLRKSRFPFSGLASQEASFVTGIALLVDGGLNAIKQPLGSSWVQGGFFSPLDNSLSIYNVLAYLSI
jgi:hypothetical protein